MRVREAHFEISIQHVCGDVVLRMGEMEGDRGRVRRKEGREGEKKRSGKGGK